MKRPEGFDPPAPPPSRPVKPKSQAGPAATKPTKKTPAARDQKPIRPTSPAPSEVVDAPARATLAKAARARRRTARADARRFTRRSRNRRLALGAVAGVIVTLIALIFVAVYSPLLALRTITIDGTSRVNAEEVRDAVSGQLGTPLALIDFTRITSELAAFPLIRSYVTETVPPDTLLIHVVERQPVGAILSGGTFKLVDPAGVVVADSTEIVPGVPIIDIGGGEITGTAFSSIVEVLLAMPPGLLAQVDTISATTQDNVSILLVGVGQRVTWGSADDSTRKAALLAALIAATDPAQPGVFDVSAPTNGVFRPQ